ncbi:hypothetical protein ACTHPH_07455 [Paenibacillus pasadenensis]|uniref:Uncharacterized protein n=1 Tax=Paenibacillus pasadenensis TaxID=217090 RepID=A0A2N5N9Q6_9BACL|nr:MULTISPECIES: hypothetical protein [Paenibacillus]PLT47064.1 hypothetical protein B8V81_1288 [Paenibacillus pasadenensis]QGG57404.1 hypothetical protein GE073_18585 [Paenibacillus sp. B01]
MSRPENQLQAIVSQVVKLETLQEVNTRALGELASGVARLIERLEKSDETAREAAQRARAAHHRIDEIRASIDGIKQGQRWLITTSFTLIGLAASLLGLVFKILE